MTGHTVAWISGDGRIHVRDFGDVADEQTLGPAAGVYGSYWGVRMSGRYVGAVYEEDGGSTTRIRVFDRSTGRQASDVRIPGSGCAAEVTGWELESSGAVVAIHSAGDECQSYSLGWTRRSERLLRDVVRVSHKAAFDSPVRAVYGRAVFLHGSERKTRLALVTPSGAVTDISFPLPAASFGAYDFDGRRVAFATKHCLYLATLPITAPDTPPAGPCRQCAAADRTARRDAAGSRRSAAPLDAQSISATRSASMTPR
jgi:hypothetical protein